MLTDKVKQTIKRHGLLEHGDSVICAVSGGADSVCLLHVMLRLKKEYGLKVYAANVNHLIRGEEAERDSSFVKSICRAADTECFYREYDVPKIAAERNRERRSAAESSATSFLRSFLKSSAAQKSQRGTTSTIMPKRCFFALCAAAPQADFAEFLTAAEISSVRCLIAAAAKLRIIL